MHIRVIYISSDVRIHLLIFSVFLQFVPLLNRMFDPLSMRYEYKLSERARLEVNAEAAINNFVIFAIQIRDEKLFTSEKKKK